MDTIKQLNAYLRDKRDQNGCVGAIKCASGLELSVQASDFHLCSPKNNEGPWTSVEVGYPSKRVADLLPYRERSSPRQMVSPIYPYVPIRVVAKIVDKHGGLVE